MAEKIAIIDCGTNTFHLMIVSVGKQSEVLHKEKMVVKIGEGGINDKLITEAAIKRATKALIDFKIIIDSQQVTTIHAFATSAFRNAHNGESLKNQIKAETDIDINIISGDDEATFIFYGVNAALDIGQKPALVMDIGGGSVEFIIGKKDHILWKKSFELGAQRLLDLFHHTEPIDRADLSNLFKFLKTELSELTEAIDTHSPSTLIGSSGTFDTLSDIYCAKHNISHDDNAFEVPLDINGFEDIYLELLSKNREDRLNIPGMIAMRVDMIVVASALIKYLLKEHRFRELRVSTHALKEGVLSQIINKQL